MSVDLKFSQIPVDALAFVWPTARHQLLRAMNRPGSRRHIGEIRDALWAKKMMLWLVYDGTEIIAVLTTVVNNYPQRRMLTIDCAAGYRVRDWLSLVLATFDEYAVDMDCEGVETGGRRGWARLLAAYGWKQTMVVCEKRVQRIESTDGLPLRQHR